MRNAQLVISYIIIAVIICCSRGQLGHGDTENQAEARLIEALEGVTVTDLAAGSWHSMVLSGR